ncbi:hypothetical protein AGDE_15597 [Angomonas deanei]|uniref:Uncharacterized protein n=1 Tax=Angomonas deanei TaxID=59799 RepID=A0A7G2BZB8_9TRYP|nr:hypothetical protein AGDE_15597 [Angomonas deanei]CAD2212896.1 hypothetical protein, conserved [Angomonas deanei]|eukprot:EPY18786.1 hypothetical protein AGDE_15597 [Angomonas deanei]
MAGFQCFRRPRFGVGGTGGGRGASVRRAAPETAGGQPPAPNITQREPLQNPFFRRRGQQRWPWAARRLPKRLGFAVALVGFAGLLRFPFGGPRSVLGRGPPGSRGRVPGPWAFFSGPSSAKRDKKVIPGPSADLALPQSNGVTGLAAGFDSSFRRPRLLLVGVGRSRLFFPDPQRGCFRCAALLFRRVRLVPSLPRGFGGVAELVLLWLSVVPRAPPPPGPQGGVLKGKASWLPVPETLMGRHALGGRRAPGQEEKKIGGGGRGRAHFVPVRQWTGADFPPWVDVRPPRNVAHPAPHV